jgi:hypothetical protein
MSLVLVNTRSVEVSIKTVALGSGLAANVQRMHWPSARAMNKCEWAVETERLVMTSRPVPIFVTKDSNSAEPWVIESGGLLF